MLLNYKHLFFVCTKVIDLSGNTISSLHGLEDHPYLCEINMEDNKVSLLHIALRNNGFN